MMLKYFETDHHRLDVQGVIPFCHKLAPFFIRNLLYSLIPDTTKHISVAGIGSSVISGDSLGSFVGTLLQSLYPGHLKVFGSLSAPLDAAALTPSFHGMKKPKNSFVIAVDSVLGPKESMNHIVIREGAIMPGAGLGQTLPAIGSCSVMGVVLENGPAKEDSLVFADLNIIYTMAVNIAKGISLFIRQFFHYPSDQPILLLQ